MGKPHQDIFACVDCEATGLDPENDRIVEVAFVLFQGREVLEQYETLIDPQCRIPEASTAIHGITQDMVQKKPTIDKVLPALLDKIENHTLVGHGIGYDTAILSQAAKRAGIACNLSKNPVIDTLRMARLYGGCPVNSLAQLRAHFNIGELGAHRAMNDVLVNLEVFYQLAKSFSTTKQLMGALEKPVRLKTMPLGQHKGRPFSEIPLTYLKWMANGKFDHDLLFSIRSEINRRKKGNLFSQATNPFSEL